MKLNDIIILKSKVMINARIFYDYPLVIRFEFYRNRVDRHVRDRRSNFDSIHSGDSASDLLVTPTLSSSTAASRLILESMY